MAPLLYTVLLNAGYFMGEYVPSRQQKEGEGLVASWSETRLDTKTWPYQNERSGERGKNFSLPGNVMRVVEGRNKAIHHCYTALAAALHYSWGKKQEKKSLVK